MSNSLNIFCPTCGWIISEEEKCFNGLAENRKCTLMAKIITASDMLSRLNDKQHQTQITRLNEQITDWKQELGLLSVNEIFIDGETRGL